MIYGGGGEGALLNEAFELGKTRLAGSIESVEYFTFFYLYAARDL